MAMFVNEQMCYHHVCPDSLRALVWYDGVVGDDVPDSFYSPTELSTELLLLPEAGPNPATKRTFLRFFRRS